MTEAYTYTIGGITVEVAHTEWDCGDGCCSSSGNYARIEDRLTPVFDLGGENTDGHYTPEAYAQYAFGKYLEHRDYHMKYAGMAQARANDAAAHKQQNDYLSALMCAYLFCRSITKQPRSFGQSRHAKIREAQCVKLCEGLYAAIVDHWGIISSYAAQLDEMLGIDDTTDYMERV